MFPEKIWSNAGATEGAARETAGFPVSVHLLSLPWDVPGMDLSVSQGDLPTEPSHQPSTSNIQRIPSCLYM